MNKDARCITKMILNLTLEIIYLLTGEDYGPIRNSCNQHVTLSNNNSVSEWRGSQSPIMEPPSPSLWPIRNKKILEITQNIIELLTEEIPIRCQDVTVYFSMEEWGYLEQHKDLYKEVMMEVDQIYYPEGDESPEECHVESIISQNGEVNNAPRRTSHPVNNADNKDIPNAVNCLEMNDSYGGKTLQGTNLSVVKEDATFQARSRHKKNAPFETREGTTPFLAKEETTLFNSLTFKAKEQIDLNHIEETLADLDFCPSTNSINGTSTQLELIEGQNATDMCPTLDKNTVLDTETIKLKLIEKDIIASSNQDEETDEGSEGQAEFDEEPKLLQMSINEEIVFDLQETSFLGQKLFMCNECGKSFNKNSQLVEHHRLHSTEKPFACPECGKQFADRANVIAHQMVHNKMCSPVGEHSSGEGLVCMECGMTFANSSAFEEHQKVHLQEKAFVCPVCGKSFSRRGHLSNHTKIHNGGKRIPYKEDSNKCFPHSSYKRKRSFVCPECGKCFPSRCHLDRHQRVHTGEKPFSCLYCDRRFTDRSGLVIHQRTHTGEKPYSCNDCGKGFRDRSGLVVHQRTHTGEQPYKCLQCGKCFHNRTRLDQHKSVHAAKKVYPCPQCNQIFLDITAFALHHQTHFVDLSQIVRAKSNPSLLVSKENQEAP